MGHGKYKKNKWSEDTFEDVTDGYNYMERRNQSPYYRADGITFVRRYRNVNNKIETYYDEVFAIKDTPEGTSYTYLTEKYTWGYSEDEPPKQQALPSMIYSKGMREKALAIMEKYNSKVCTSPI